MLPNSKYFQNPEFGFPYLPQFDGEEKIKQCRYLIEQSKNIVILTGAGMSTDSGLPDFRSQDGLYINSKEKIKPEELLSIGFFKRNGNAKKTYDFLNKKLDVKNVKPNKGHKLLADLETKKNVQIITQNIDGLHQMAGSKNVLEFHGTLKTATCMKCGKKYNMDDIRHNNEFYCDCKINSHKGLIKPDIVFYDEHVNLLQDAISIVQKSDLMIVLGTSLKVSPFNMLPQYTRAGVPIIVINNDDTYLNDDRMSVCFKDNIKDTLEKIINGVN